MSPEVFDSSTNRAVVVLWTRKELPIITRTPTYTGCVSDMAILQASSLETEQWADMLLH